jgi:hypothetical protein
MAGIPALSKSMRPAAFTLVTLQTMPCGCVAAIYRARPTVVEFDVLEAKGPHCRFYGHRPGEVIDLGVSDPGVFDEGALDA